MQPVQAKGYRMTKEQEISHHLEKLSELLYGIKDIKVINFNFGIARDAWPYVGTRDSLHIADITFKFDIPMPSKPKFKTVQEAYEYIWNKAYNEFDEREANIIAVRGAWDLFNKGTK